MKCPQVTDEMSNFENDQLNIINALKFRNTRKSFQTKGNNDWKKICRSQKVFISNRLIRKNIKKRARIISNPD